MVNEPAEPSCPQRVETTGFTNPSQQWCTRHWGFHAVRGGIVRGDNRFRPRIIRVVDIRKAFCSEDGIVYFPGAGLHEPQPISNKTAGLGFPHRARRYRPGGPPFSSPVCWSCRCMEENPIRGWEHIPPGWRWALALRTPGWGFHTVRGGIDPWDNHVRLQYVGVADVRNDL